MIKPGGSWADFAERIVPNYGKVWWGYTLLRMMQEHSECYVEGIAAMKRQIRKVVKAVEDPLTAKVRVIYDSDTGGYDGWYELVCLDTSDADVADEKFKSVFYRKAWPSQYDCTGQVFTGWYSLFKRPDGMYWAIHRLCRDV